jgi:hypothetical protein
VTWFRVDDHFHTHSKVLDLDPKVGALHARLSACSMVQVSPIFRIDS